MTPRLCGMNAAAHHGGRRAGKYFVRLYEEFSGGLWLKTISVLNDSGLEVRYLRVKD